MKIAFIGIGNVGFAIANNLQNRGHQIVIANNNASSESVKKALIQNQNFTIQNVQQAVDNSEIVFLATPFQANEVALKDIKFNGKTLVDCTNPVGAGLSHGLNNIKSGSEFVQEIAPDANVVKAFTIYGYENFIDSSYPKYDVKPVMLICGNSDDSKKLVSKLVEDLGFYAKDTGGVSMALHLEHMTLLWVKMVRMNQNQPNFVWGYLEK